MTKAAIANFTKELAESLTEELVSASMPGPIWAPLQEADGNEKKLKKLGQNTAFRRPGQPAELGPFYVLLASQEGSYIIGEIYGVTGGSGIA